MLLLQGNPDAYDDYDVQTTNSFDFRDQGPTIEEVHKHIYYVTIECIFSGYGGGRYLM